jgi:hypothetical protein
MSDSTPVETLSYLAAELDNLGIGYLHAIDPLSDGTKRQADQGRCLRHWLVEFWERPGFRDAFVCAPGTGIDAHVDRELFMPDCHGGSRAFILELAQRGERDSIRLCDDALAYLREQSADGRRGGSPR